MEESLRTQQCKSQREFTYLDFEFLQQRRADLSFLMEKVFPYGEYLFQCPYIVGFFPCRDPSDYNGTQNARHSHIRFLGEYLGHVGATWLCHPSPSGPSTLNSPSPLKGPSTLKGSFVSQLSVQDETLSTRSLTVKLSEQSLGVTVALLLAQQIGSVCYGIYPYQPLRQSMSSGVKEGT